MKNLSHTRSINTGNPSGFSFVEIMISAAIISIMLVAIVAMVRKGQEWIPLDRHMQFARGIISRTLEKEAYQPDNYNNIVSDTTVTETVILDPKTNLQGTFSITISPETAQISGVTVPHKEITAVISWSEPGNPVTQTVRIVKWVTYLQH
jgi:prepilin-type N-terminal cleavage/methylation domain-containing protein